jgi:hypothetical protein
LWPRSTRTWTPTPPPRHACHDDPGPHPEAPHIKIRPARTRNRGFSAEQQTAKAALRCADAVLADTRALLALLAAGVVHQTPPAPPACAS